MLDFFMCWTDSDPVYQDYLPDCNILVSLPHVAQSWNVKKFSTPPRKLIIDSGAFTLLSNPSLKMNQSKVFNLQLNISRGSSVPTLLCHLDNPIPPSVTNTVDVYRRIETTLANAYEFMHLFKSSGLPSNYKSLGVIQGNSYDTLTFCAREMNRMGFDMLGIGSLAPLFKMEIILDRVRWVTSVTGPDIHVFGISGLEVGSKLMEMGIQSIDSSRAMRIAINNCVIYSLPFRYFKISARVNKSLPLLEAPILCDCPICKKDPNLILKAGEKRYNNMRAVHNFYHLRKELEEVYVSFHRSNP
ncbi:hypothetical protein JCM14036_12450 [Desulfotomaculum defluvii]